jgi:hypothetical protein
MFSPTCLVLDELQNSLTPKQLDGILHHTNPSQVLVLSDTPSGFSVVKFLELLKFFYCANYKALVAQVSLSKLDTMMEDTPELLLPPLVRVFADV